MGFEILACSQELGQGEDSLDEIKILPLGLVKSQKGKFFVDKEGYNLMKKTFVERGIDVVVDYEHQTLGDIQAPAGGWIKDLFLKEDAIVAQVEWTQKAKEYIANKEYRYLSPVVQVRKKDRKAISLHSVALTNTPAIDCMYTIKNSLDIEGIEEMELLEQLITLLGLAEGATEEEVLSKLKELKTAGEGTENKKETTTVVANKEVLEVLGLKTNAKQEDVINVIMQLKNPASNKVVKELIAFKEQYAKKEAEEKVLVAMKEGKLTKVQEEWAMQYALSAPKGFDDYIKNAPVIVPMGQIQLNKEINSIDDETIRSVNKLFGYTKEEVEKYGKVGKVK